MEGFKSSLVGKSCNLFEDEIENLPEELRKLWIDRKFTLFLDKFKDIITNGPTDKSRRKVISTDIKKRINPVLPFLSELGYSFDNEVHKRIHECYEGLSKLYNDPLPRLSGEFPRRVASSSNKYLVNILCPERKIFCTDDFMKQHLTFISGRWEEQTLKLKIDFKSHEQKDLQQTAPDFLDKSYIYLLSDTTFPDLPDVYLIYHVGKTQLYEGSQVFPSIENPVYVGMSKRDTISRRLKTHLRNIRKAIDEQTGQEKHTDEEEEEQTEDNEQTKEELTERKKLPENKQTERGTQTEGMKMELSDFVV